MTTPKPSTAALSLLLCGLAAALLPWPSDVVPFAYSVEFIPAGSSDADAITRTPAVKYAVVSFESQAGRMYRVQRRDEISDWTDIEAVTGTGQRSRSLFMLCSDDATNQWRVTP
jgi:hypothetical protein